MADGARGLPGLTPAGTMSTGPEKERRPLIDKVPEMPEPGFPGWDGARGWSRERNIINIVGKFQRSLTHSQEQYLIKMLGSTSFKHQHHHIFEKWTRTDIMVTTVILGILGILELAMVNVWQSYQDIPSGSDSQASAIGAGWMFLGPLSTITAIVGFVGAYKIKFDVQNHIEANGLGSAKALNMNAGQPKLAGDGSVVEMQRWTSHKLLLAYFYLSWFTSIGTILIAVLTFLAGADKKNSASQSNLE